MGFFDSILGGTAADAAKHAAADTYEKQQIATKKFNREGDDYADSMRSLSKLFQPYSAAGGSALNQLMGGLGLGGNGSAAFTEAYRALPGYQAGLDRGVNAVNSTANARGMLNSGANEKALYRFGSDYEDQRVGDYLSRLFGLAGMGQQATGQQVATAGQGLTGKLNQRTSAYGGQMQSAQTIGQGEVAAAQAEQNALTNLLGMAGYLGGAALGSPWVGTSLGFGGGGGVLPGGKPLGQGGIGSR